MSKYDIQINVGKRIKELRNERSLSQEKLALLADLDRTYINSIENGKRNVSIVNIQKISTALDCSVQEFFKSQLFN